MTRPPVDLCVDDETISSDALSLARACVLETRRRLDERGKGVLSVELEALFPL